jgi:NAD(P)-dependent dehydrogenase (short-subunit alcohol dehydrogenase family)
MTAADMGTKLTDLAVKSFGRLDGIVINHGVLESRRFEDLDMASLKQLYDVNVFSCAALAKAGLKELRKTKGSIVWVSSGAASNAYQSWTAYGSSKAAMNSLSAQLAAEEPDVTSVAVAPGRVDTDMQAIIRSEGSASMDKATYDNFVDAFTTGKLLKPEQPGNVMARLAASPDQSLSGKFVK